MFSHANLWAAIDALANSLGTSTSGLAKKAGLDSTSFNKSKRFSSDGKPRWPSTESLARVLEATNLTLLEFMQFMPNEKNFLQTSLPLITEKNFGKKNIFEKKQIKDFFSFPDFAPNSVFVFELQSYQFEPYFSAGNHLICEPDARLRKGDWILVKTKKEVILAKFDRILANKIKLLSLPHQKPMQKSQDELECVARILWASR